MFSLSVNNKCVYVCLFVSVGILPRSWCRYTVPTAMTVIQWVADFSERIKQLQHISQGAASGGAKELKVVWFTVHPQDHKTGVLNSAIDSAETDRGTHGTVVSPFSSPLRFTRTSTCASAACLFQRLTSPQRASMWHRQTAGLWKSCVWRLTSPLPRAPHWTPAASASKVRKTKLKVV